MLPKIIRMMETVYIDYSMTLSKEETIDLVRPMSIGWQR